MIDLPDVRLEKLYDFFSIVITLYDRDVRKRKRDEMDIEHSASKGFPT